MWIAASERGWRFHHLDAVTFEYRVRPGSLIFTTLTLETARQLYQHIVRKHKPLYMEWIGAILRQIVREGSPGPAAESNLEFLMDEWKVDWDSLQQEQASVLALHGIEEDRNHWKLRCVEAEADAEDSQERFSNTERMLRLREEELNEARTALKSGQLELQAMEAGLLANKRELAAIRSSATWRWTQFVLGGWPLKQLLGPLIHFVAKRSQQPNPGGRGVIGSGRLGS